MGSLRSRYASVGANGHAQCSAGPQGKVALFTCQISINTVRLKNCNSNRTVTVLLPAPLSGDLPEAAYIPTARRSMAWDQRGDRVFVIFNEIIRTKESCFSVAR